MKEQLYPDLYDQTAVERASEKDRIFFEQHPGAKHYFRPFISGEAPLKGIEITKVIQLYPGARTRQFFYKNGGRA